MSDIVYYVPYASVSSDEIIEYDMEKAKNIRESDGRISFSLGKYYYELGKGRWSRDKIVALYIIQEHLYGKMNLYETLMNKITREINTSQEKIS